MSTFPPKSFDMGQYVRKGASLSNAVVFGFLVTFQLLPKVLAMRKSKTKNYYMLFIFFAVLLHSTMLILDCTLWLTKFAPSDAQQVFHKSYEFMNSVFRLLIGYVFVRLPSPHPTVSKCLAWGRNFITLGSFVCLFAEIAINYTINILHYYDIFDSFLIFCVLCYSLWFLKVGSRFKNQSGNNQQHYNGLIYRIQQMLFISVLDMICVSLIVVLAPLKLERVPQIAKPTLLYLYIYILAQTNEEGDARPKTKSNSSGKAINSSS